MTLHAGKSRAVERCVSFLFSQALIQSRAINGFMGLGNSVGILSVTVLGSI